MKCKGQTSAIDCRNASATARSHPTGIQGCQFDPAISLCNEPPMLRHRTTLHHRRGFSLLAHSKWKFSKIWNGANAQGKYNTISTSTVARHLWSRQNTKNAVLFFSACRNHFMQVKWYSMFILSCKVVRVCLLNEGWIHPGCWLGSLLTATPFSNCPLPHHRHHHHHHPPLSFHPSTLCCATPVNIRVHWVVLAVSHLQIHFSRQNWMWDYYPVVQLHFKTTDVLVESFFSFFPGKCITL